MVRGLLEIRPAVRADEAAIRRLLDRSARPCVRSWWWEEHLGTETFLLTLADGYLVGALLALPDDSPVAWVRLGVLAPEIPAGLWLDATLPHLEAPLRALGARALAWTDVGGWMGEALRTRRFRLLAYLVTLRKDDRFLPPMPSSAPCTVRPAQAEDIPHLVCLDHDAFPSPWWFSAATLEHIRQEAACFLVAERDGLLVGYAEARSANHGAHIGRLAVAPGFQRRGVGSYLLRTVLLRLWQQGVKAVTLNTQVDNVASRRLYERFGFQPVGSRITAWWRALDKTETGR
ncbi:MAG: GNAT family N-acetyltransferase [Anaerolineae bacterium]|nr:GNAT family N-acetyltransferase [Anaerolineae bacterium]MDW8067704.1 GNAT family N-acetyltransferase [Anaerolineae bacterium]